jgi:glyoxylase-like metal-dependent hydrolase (beta-lactamase superfamily II)
MNRGHNKGVFAIALFAVVATWWSAGRAEALENGMVHTISGRGANVYLIKGEAGWVLVDAGMKGNAERLQKAFSDLGVDPRTIGLIVITHAHPDHYGELASLKRLTGAKVLAHRYEASFIESGRNSPIVAQTAKGWLINAISPKWKMESTPVETVLDDELDLAEFGVGGKVVCTPGHTAGSLSIVLEDGSVLVGDQFRGKAGRLTLGMFYEDRRTLITSLKRIAGFDPKVLYMSHGASTDLTDLVAFISALKE